jgi:hypothetical protein
MPDSLKSLILSILCLDVEVIEGLAGIREDIQVRGTDDAFQKPHGWVISSEVITQSAFFNFKFDSQAKNLQDFYVSRLVEIAPYWQLTESELEGIGLNLKISLNGKSVKASEIDSTLRIESLEVSGRVDVIDENLQLIPIAEIESHFIRFISLALLPLIPDDSAAEYGDSSEMGMPEGAVTKVLVNKYERSPRNRAACLAHYGSSCQGCGFSFAEKYGDIASGYIHVHHLVPISLIGRDYRINPIEDLIPLCPNCHAAIHLQNPPFSLEQLRAMTGFLQKKQEN